MRFFADGRHFGFGYLLPSQQTGMVQLSDLSNIQIEIVLPESPCEEG
jgi:hypothetical protein